MTMQRYAPTAFGNMLPSDAGPWVRLTDAQAAIKAARRKALEDAAKLLAGHAQAARKERFAALAEGCPLLAQSMFDQAEAFDDAAAAIRAMMENDDAA